MSWQEWIVTIVVLFCIFEVLRRFLRFFLSSKNNESPCASCSTGCDLKSMMDKKQEECRKNKEGKNKKCCG